MGRALHVSRNFPPFLISARLGAAVEKSIAVPSCAESFLPDGRDRDPRMLNLRRSTTGLLPFSARKPVQGPKDILRACENTMGGVLARRFSSGTEFSDSEWPETDDDHGHSTVSGHSVRSRQLPARHTRTQYEAESETGESSKEEDDYQRRPMQGSRLHRVEEEQGDQHEAVCATQTESDSNTVLSSSNEDEHQSYERPKSLSREFKPIAGSCGLSADCDEGRWPSYATESDTDDEFVGSTSKRGEWKPQGRLKLGHHETDSRKHARQEYVQQIAQASETNAEADTLRSTSKENMLLHHGDGEYRSLSETGSETDTEPEALTWHEMESDEDEAVHHGRPHSRSHCPPAKLEDSQIQHAIYETASETDGEYEKNECLHSKKGQMYDLREDIAASRATSRESDDKQYTEDNESEDDSAASGLSDWEETDEDDSVKLWKEVYGSDEDTQSTSLGPSKLSKGLDKLYSKTYAQDRSHGGSRTLEKPSRKERSAGLSPRTIRDDDSDDVEIESDLEGELQEEIERQMAAEPKFERPSITWGILLTRDLRLEARNNVLKYLEAEGIDTDELKCIELPTKVEVMQTRLGFLRKIGLDNDAINNYPLILGCSVPKNIVPVLKYLKKLGFPQPWVPLLLKKYPMILQASVVIDILPVIYFLRGLDIDAIDLPRVIMKYPELLAFKTEGTMSTSVAYLVSMGVDLRHMGYMLTEFPEILGMRVASVLKPKYEYLMSLGIPQMIVAKILARRPHLLGYDLEKRMQSNVDLLIELGVRKEAIPGMVAQFPEILGRVFAHFVKDHLDWLKENLELDADSVARIIENMPQVIFMPTAMAMERIRFLKSERFTYAEVGSMVAQCPQILVSSIYDNLRPNLNFLTREMKRSRAELLDFPAFFTYSLHSRIRPRFQVLNGENVQCTLDWLLNCTEFEFQKRLKSGYKANEKQIGIEFVMGGPLSKKPAIDEGELQPAELSKVAAL